MKKKPRNPAKKANSFGSMGRIVFYSIALIVACCAVAVVLFETEAGQELVAKVRGEESPNTRAKTKFTETRPSEEKPNKESGEPKTATQPETAESELPRGENVLSRESEKDTSPDPSDSPNEASESTTDDIGKTNNAREENLASETQGKNDEEFPSEAEPHIDEKEDWEIMDEKIDEDEQEQLVEELVKPVEEQEKPAEDLAENLEKPVEEQDKPVVELDKPVEEQEKPAEEQQKAAEEPGFVGDNDRDGNMEETEQNVLETVNEVEENEQDDRKDVEQEVDGGEVEQEETITVGDSLAELEKQRYNEHLIVEEEPYDPIPEPEGPPIDLSPVNARRGLRGDYGGKDCKDSNKNCVGWAKLGECKKNPVWMEVNCKKSCKVCSCSDNDTKCVGWAETGECKKNAAWMNQNCMKSCEQC